MSTMRAYRMVGWEQPPQVVDVDVPRPGRGQVRVAVGGNGLCHSDLSMMQIPAAYGATLGWRVPFTLGHEIAGWVDELGEGATDLAVGDRVALVSPTSCGSCSHCRRGHDGACKRGGVGRGYGRDGGLAPYVLAGAAREVIKLTTLEPIAAAPLTDAGATSYHAVKRALPHLVPGSTAVVLGAGGLGTFAVQILRALSPATVVAVDTNPTRLELARQLGAHHALAGVGDTTTDDVRALTDGEGADAVLDFVGIDQSIQAGVAAVRRSGVFALVGAAGGTLRKPWYGHLPREADIFTFQGSDIADAHEVIALAEAGLVHSEVDVFAFDRVAEAYEALAAGTLRGRAVVTPDR